MNSANEMPRALDAMLEEPEALEAWLAAREASFGDVRPDADAKIVWAHADRRRTPVALVYLHGFSASRMETAPLCDRVAESLGANLFYARLAGHGRGSAAMGEARMDDWLADADLAWRIARRLGERVVLIGTSTGGTLATLTAVRRTDPALTALVLISPNFRPADRRAAVLTWPGARLWLPCLVGRERVVQPENPGHAAHWTTRYPSTAMIPMMQLVRAVKRAPARSLATPTLVLMDPDDAVVDARRTVSVLGRLGARPLEIEEVTDAGDIQRHVIAGDAFSPATTERVAARIVAFLEQPGVAAEDASAPG